MSASTMSAANPCNDGQLKKDRFYRTCNASHEPTHPEPSISTAADMHTVSCRRFGNRISSSEGQPPLSADAHGPGTLATQVVDYADGSSAVYYSATCVLCAGGSAGVLHASHDRTKGSTYETQLLTMPLVRDAIHIYSCRKHMRISAPICPLQGGRRLLAGIAVCGG
jgi:hypothetical protein